MPAECRAIWPRLSRRASRFGRPPEYNRRRVDEFMRELDRRAVAAALLLRAGLVLPDAADDVAARGDDGDLHDEGALRQAAEVDRRGDAAALAHRHAAVVDEDDDLLV